MPFTADVTFAGLEPDAAACLILLANEAGDLSATGQMLDKTSGGALTRAMTAAGFSGKPKSMVEVLGAAKLAHTRILVMGVGKAPNDMDRLALGGVIAAAVSSRKVAAASIVVEVDGLGAGATTTLAADLAHGALLRSYTFDTYRTRRRDDDNADSASAGEVLRLALTFHTPKPAAAEAQFNRHRAVAAGVELARDLINEPANVLGPSEFADRLKTLTEDGLDVEVLDVDRLTELKMGALLAVAQGSARPARVVVMQWHGAKTKKGKSLCFAGKGVTFDTGGISIKPAAGMEEMKGDMAGAACVAGLLRALARRKAPVHAIGIVGLVENMPSGSATRPGDIVTSMSGQTIEVVNTDAEGRLVLADVVHYAATTFQPRFIIDLATLTGAIGVALGKEFAGLFSTDDNLATQIIAAGQATGEKVWRMPLAKAYDRAIDSRFADMKNSAGRPAGASTGAHFIGRFVGSTPWAHIDIAGVALDSPKSDISASWSSGWGVRLLDRLITDQFEGGEK
jgi:leucyl aminopeptidase